MIIINFINICLHLNILITSNRVIHLLLIWQVSRALHIIISVFKASVMSFRKLSSCKTMGNNTLSDKKKHNFPPDHHSPSRKTSFDSSSRALQCYNTVKAGLTLVSS